MKRTITIVLFIFLFQLSAYAGGPLPDIVNNGMILTYSSNPLLLRFDQGPLGMFSNSEAVHLFDDLFSIFENVETASIKFQKDNPAFLALDVDGTNYQSFISPEQFLDYIPIIFDHDGSITQDIYGSPNAATGFALPLIDSNEIRQSFIVINGRVADGILNSDNPEETLNNLKSAILHEIGHAIGLDHSQINVEAIYPNPSQKITHSVPLMFPYPTSEVEPTKLKRDDISAISLLYPNQEMLNSYATIEGKILREDGITPVQGANVIARNLNDPLNEAVSCVSGYLIDNTGSFTLLALPPGNYTLEVERISFSFSSPSTVGPYASTETDLSFQNQVLKGFYNESTMGLTRDKNQATIISLKEGEKLADLEIITGLNELLISPQQTIDETNNSTTSANSVTIPVIVKGNSSSNDLEGITIVDGWSNSIILSDLYKIKIDKPTEILARLDIESDYESNNLDLYLLKKRGSKLYYSNKTKSPIEIINLELKPGNYILGVGAKTGSSHYTLTLTGTPAIRPFQKRLRPQKYQQTRLMLYR